MRNILMIIIGLIIVSIFAIGLSITDNESKEEVSMDESFDPPSEIFQEGLLEFSKRR